jgi:hypothetical protein
MRNTDLGVVAVEDAGDFLESGAPVKDEVLVKSCRERARQEGKTYLVST